MLASSMVWLVLTWQFYHLTTVAGLLFASMGPRHKGRGNVVDLALSTGLRGDASHDAFLFLTAAAYFGCGFRLR